MVVLEKIKSYSLKLYVIKNKIPIESIEKREIEGPKMNDNGNNERMKIFKLSICFFCITTSLF